MSEPMDDATWTWADAFLPRLEPLGDTEWDLDYTWAIPPGNSLQRVLVHPGVSFYTAFYQDPGAPVNAGSLMLWSFGVVVRDTGFARLLTRRWIQVMPEVSIGAPTVSGQQQVRMSWQAPPGYWDVDITARRKIVGTGGVYFFIQCGVQSSGAGEILPQHQGPGPTAQILQTSP